MTHDPNNWTAPVPVSYAVPDTALSTCRRCAAVVLIHWDDARILHDAWHDDIAHQLAQARA